MKKKIGRNDPCPCGSGKKYKKCCLAKDAMNMPFLEALGSQDLTGIPEAIEIGEMIPFSNRFPKLAEVETRRVLVLGDDNEWDLPVGTYSFLESYCGDSKCDCRRVFLNAAYTRKDSPRREAPRILATIGYGWDSLDYYANWFKMGNSEMDETDESIIRDLKGPILESGSFYSEYSERLLRFFKESTVKDTFFVERLKRHYALFKSFKQC